MKKILFVEDNPVVSKIYAGKLAEGGFEVAVAEDGLVAMKRLPEFMPDLVVLDLLMPRMTGVDVLKFMRQRPDLKSTRVIVFSNAFLSGLVHEVSFMDVEKALVKSAVTPSALLETVAEVLKSPGRRSPAPEKAGASATNVKKAGPAAGAGRMPGRVDANLRPIPGNEGSSPFCAGTGRETSEMIPVILRDLRQTFREYLEAAEAPDQSATLLALNRKLSFLTQIGGMAGYHRSAELSSALEALVFEVLNKSAPLNESVQQTMAGTIALLAQRFDSTEPANEQNRPPAAILVVDDDQITNRAVVQALARAKLPATGLNDPFDALKKLEQNPYDVVLLDIAMPGMDGLALCEQMRCLPFHKRTPVIFVTSYTDFKTRARSIVSGGDDLITKPIFPTELCVKVITHFLKAGQVVG